MIPRRRRSDPRPIDWVLASFWIAYACLFGWSVWMAVR